MPQHSPSPRPLDPDAFTDGIEALKIQIGRERRIHAGTAAAVCAHLDAAAKVARASLATAGAPALDLARREALDMVFQASLERYPRITAALAASERCT